MSRDGSLKPRLPEFGKYIRDRRRELGMTQTQLAKAVNRRLAEMREEELVGLLTRAVVSLGAERAKETVDFAIESPTERRRCHERINQIVVYLDKHPVAQ